MVRTVGVGGGRGRVALWKVCAAGYQEGVRPWEGRVALWKVCAAGYQEGARPLRSLLFVALVYSVGFHHRGCGGGLASRGCQ